MLIDVFGFLARAFVLFAPTPAPTHAPHQPAPHIAVSIPLMGTPGAGSGSASAADAVVDSVQKFYANIKQVSASFRQTVQYSTFGTDKTSDGSVLIAKPGKMRWDYVEKRKGKVEVTKSFISNGQYLYLVEHDNKQVSKKNLHSSEGTAYGSVMSFTTAAAPTVTTAAATPVTSSTATLNGSANPNGASASGWFRYSTTNPGSCNDTFGTLVTWTGLGSGTTSVAFSQGIGGLSPGTTYYHCAIANNSIGTGFGAVLSFTTPPSAPTVTTGLPTGVTTTTATLNGTANPNGSAAAGWFRIGAANPGVCDDLFGTRLPAASGTALGAGNSAVAYSNSVPGIVAGKTYYYCAIASNAVGTSFGVVRSFTAPAPPTVATLAATPVTATTATLNGSGNPNGNAATAWFRYATTTPGTCNDTFGIRTPIAGGLNLGSGTAPISYGQPVSGLAAATTYYFCTIASNTIGTSFGAVLSFTTPPSTPGVKSGASATGGSTGSAVAVAPSVTTVAASAVASDSVVLNATANPNGYAAQGWFRYAATDPETCNDTFGTRAPANGTSPLGAGAGLVEYAQTVPDLAPGVTYYYCALASNGVGTSFGKLLSVTTKAAAPSVTTTSPIGVVSDAAVLGASAVPNGDAATGWFRYDTTDPGICNDRFGVRVPASGGQALGAGVAAMAYMQALSDLTPGTTYYYCAIAANALGTTLGKVLSFVPGAGAPAVVTAVATDVGGSSATITGTVQPNGSPTSAWFRYGEVNPGVCDDTFGSRAPATAGTAIAAETNPSLDVDPQVGPTAYSEPLTGLKPNFTYYYCAAASNLGGATFGQVLSFTTAPLAPLVQTTSAKVDEVGSTKVSEVESAGMGGCAYRASTSGSSSLLSLLTILPLLGILLFRRRRRRA